MEDEFSYYAKSLISYSKKFNLSSFKDEEEVKEKGIKPSLSSLPYIKKGLCLDIGSGSGIPAIPLSIADKENEWIFLEPKLKKSGFLLKCILDLSLKAKVINKEATIFLKDKTEIFDTITVRQVKLTRKMIKVVYNSLKEGGIFIIFTDENMLAEYTHLLFFQGFTSVKKIQKEQLFIVAKK